MHPARDHKSYRAADYLTWPDEPRCELIDGVIHDMVPVPSLDHQDAVLELGAALRNEFRARQGDGGGGPDGCRVLISPVDVVLAEDTVVQPDLVVVCDPAKLENRRYVAGAPDLVVEVLSPTTAGKDRREKWALYQRSGVAEYLLIHPTERYAEYFRLDARGRYDLRGTPIIRPSPEDSSQDTHPKVSSQDSSQDTHHKTPRPALARKPSHLPHPVRFFGVVIRLQRKMAIPP